MRDCFNFYNIECVLIKSIGRSHVPQADHMRKPPVININMFQDAKSERKQAKSSEYYYHI